MNGEASIDDRRGMTASAAFPEKTNPNRPIPGASEPWRETRGEGRTFPPRCDPADPRRPLTEEQRRLVRRFMPLARAMSRPFQSPLLNLDELQAEAYAALVDAARLFDPGHGADFSVYARPRILGALRDYRRFVLHAGSKGKRRKRPVFERLRVSDDGRGWVIGKQPEPPPGQEIESLDVVESVIRRLPRPQALTCRSIYIEGYSAQETAEALGFSEGYVSRLHGEALTVIGRDYREALIG
jgi:RNA polymerase sigma factor (sigma-70 family)